MKKLLIGLLFLASCTPVRYVYVDPKDSVVREQRRLYQDIFTPLYFQYDWYRPYFRPIIIQRQRPIVVPQRPVIVPQRPIVVPQRPQYRPMPSRPPKWRN